MEVLLSYSSTILNMQPPRSRRKGQSGEGEAWRRGVCHFCFCFLNKTNGPIFLQGRPSLCSGRKGKLDMSEKQWLLPQQVLHFRIFLVLVSLEAVSTVHPSNLEADSHLNGS